MSKQTICASGMVYNETDLMFLDWKRRQRKPISVYAVKMTVDFIIDSTRGKINGSAGDWLLQNEAGELSVCDDVTFKAEFEREVYNLDDE